MTLTNFLITLGFHEFEGYCQQVPDQVRDLIRISKGSNINIMEIGFNAGHSAEIFLHFNRTLTLTSFDLGYHNYINPAKEYIDATYPNRHSLILGDSVLTIPKYIDANPDKTFDIIFIDGGHEYPIANADLENCRGLANKDTIVIMDDTMYTPKWEHIYTVGPTQTWVEHVKSGKITEINKVDYCEGRGMSWGKYVF